MRSQRTRVPGGLALIVERGEIRVVRPRDGNAPINAVDSDQFMEWVTTLSPIEARAVAAILNVAADQAERRG